MIQKPNFSLAMVLLVLLSAFSLPLLADRDSRADNRDGNKHRQAKQDKRSGQELDRRHQHNRYYPPRGHVVPRLPSRHYTVPHRDTRFYFSSGIWYRSYRDRFSVILPPVGVIVPILPPFYTRVWVGGSPYYYAGGVYYSWHPNKRAYIVSNPSPQSEISTKAATAQPLFVYPKTGQTEQQQAEDRYHCYRWSVDQTGFDPTQPGGNVASSQHADKHDSYQRAMQACLEARGYSVK